MSRVSVGSGPARAALGLVRRIAAELLREGIWDGFVGAGVPSHSEVNAMLARPR